MQSSIPSTSLNLANPAQWHWLEACQWLEQQGEAYCIVTIIAEVGSVPRSSGTKMVVSTQGQYCTVGGGQLEQQIIQHARKQLNLSQTEVELQRFSLAADCAQCCGGAIQAMFEYCNAQTPLVVVFGAGHVAQALCTIMAGLPCRVGVIDSRPEWVNRLTHAGIDAKVHSDPVQIISTLPTSSLLVIMTHDHQLDYNIIQAALERQCFPYIGLIGSQGKKQRFEFRLKEQLSDPNLLAQLTCPIGDKAVKGKRPMEVAVSISVQLMAMFEQLKQAKTMRKEEAEKMKVAQWRNANRVSQELSEHTNE